ncbi:acyltransferase [Sphingomonas sp. MG17]|uniref:Acyltransferase n=1 Tax=Sphingomonas tagetis TaxID=2949092 RepID=A0A9X2HQ80_9SPHN|nr:acyltransferase [Sphingomonas tagetis]MCP3731599.1 acyltransferase [Sphingomonas tagetis]
MAAAPEPDAAPAWYQMDAMRAVLALVVAFGHLWGLLIEDYRGDGSLLVRAAYFAAGFAHSAVILFFVLSGYWIARSVTARAARGWSWRGYLIDRLARLCIVLVPALALGGVLDWIGYYGLALPTHHDLTHAWVLTQDLSRSLTWTALAGNLLFLQHLLVPPFGSNGPLWSLAFEFWYYLWFPALWLSLTRRRLSLALPVLLIALANPELAFGFLSWLCGALLYFAEQRARDAGSRVPRWAAPLAGLLCLAALVWGRTGNFSAEDPLEAACFALFLFTLLRGAPRRWRLLRPFAAYGARASFSLYAIHFPVMAFLAGLAVGGQRFAPDARALTVAIAILLAVAGAGWAFAALTEARTGALRRSLHDRFAGVRVAPAAD